ncbi:hypothetical protein FisN_8Lh234 [Fistulifera solaris]|uniref:Uncharacterized protein n=1 Tax=Fistulifera solaris TaxID=1519565 RepID=A0A1Z5JN95_FISSO|nr:hypothetical protein FisN_8Lh234 [Fistulifera solaris]|eukprot:GAX15464.1 hypothetical protein FisN_8Lh234 [Fistulifera solaris]
MGQAASLPVDRREAAIGSPNIKPPAGWSNDEKEQFHPISPVSDVSNPSQFRHRLKPGEVVAPPTIYVSSTRRTSKVVGKTPARKRHSGKILNPPDRFYFPEQPSKTQPRPSHHPVRSTRWKVYKRRLTAKCHEAKKQIEAMGCCNPEQVMNHVQNPQTLGASNPVYSKDVKKHHTQVLNDSLSETGDELDPIVGVSVKEKYFGASTRRAKITALSDFPAVRQHNIDNKSMEPYLQFHGPSTVSPPESHGDSPDDLRRNNTDDSVLLEKSSAGTSSSAGSLESDNVLHARNKMESVARLHAVYRLDSKEKQTKNESEVKKLARKCTTHETNFKKSIGSSCASYDADSSSMQDSSRNGRRSEASERTHLTQSTLLADSSALLKMHIQDAVDELNSPVAALFVRDEDDDYRPRVSSGLYSDMNSLVESYGSEQKTWPTGLFTDNGSEIEQEELTHVYTVARTSMESQGTKQTLPAAYKSQDTAARVSDISMSSSNDNPAKKSMDSQESRRTVIHAVNLPLSAYNFTAAKKNSLDSRKTTNTVISSEALPLPTDRESRITMTSPKENFQEASAPSDPFLPLESENGCTAQVITKEKVREFWGNAESIEIPDGHDRRLSNNSEASVQSSILPHRANDEKEAKTQPSVRRASLRPSLKTSRRSSLVHRDSLQLPALLQIAGWKNSATSHAKAKQESHVTELNNAENVMLNEVGNDEANHLQLDSKRQSDPLPMTRAAKGATAADMLRQSYPFFAQLREAESSKRGLTTHGVRAPGAVLRSTEKVAMSSTQPSPCISVESIPMLSSQVLGNAALLFSPSYLDGTEVTGRPQSIRPHPTENGSVSINTLGSRGRTLSVVSRDPVTIPSHPVPILETDAASKQSEKRVRFSDIMNVDPGQELKPSAVEFPPIRHKLSDLSDTTGLEPYRRSISSIRESIAPIPEESTHVAYSSHQIPERTTQSRWAYAHDSDVVNGVTPLRSGRTSTHATASPLLRFQEARTKFSGGVSNKNSEAIPVGETNHVLGLKTKGSIVSARIAEMEEKTSKTKSTQPYLSKIVDKSASSIWRQPPVQVGGYTERSPTLINGSFVGSNEKAEANSGSSKESTILHEGHHSLEVMSDSGDNLTTNLNPLADNYSVVSSGGESLRDLFKTHKANIEASNDDESLSDDDVDDFENLLNYQQDLSEESTVDDETVSTVRQDRSKRFGSQYASYRMSVGGASVASSATGDTVSTIKQNRFSIASTNSSKILKWEQPSLPFRKNAPVKPTEQAVHSTRGLLTLSPLQKTPAQARKWRDLAAAAQERNTIKKGDGPNQTLRPNLGERSVNVLR